MPTDEPPVRILINEDGGIFGADLAQIRTTLEDLENSERISFRNLNATAIAQHSASRILIVAGPGAGKSHLFMTRIDFWLGVDPGCRIYVATFVRKLVRDLESDVTNRVAEELQSQISVSTLHSLARSVLERGHGTSDRPYQPHVQIISGTWAAMVWRDVLQFHPDLTSTHYTYRRFEHQLHGDEISQEDSWPSVAGSYHTLSRFFNAVGFADLIFLARETIEEDPAPVEHDHWIIDEYQDFNACEDHLIRALTTRANGVLLAGDDEQALYQTLKLSTPEIIGSYYAGSEFANAMLPYCSRCSYHVCKAASEFIEHDRGQEAIDKIYLPLIVDHDKPKVQIIATNAPGAAFDYIEKFVEDHNDEIEAYEEKMKAGEESDPFLLILTPDKKVGFYRTNGVDRKLIEFVGRWRPVSSERSLDYQLVLAYCRSAWSPEDNFSYRKVLDHEAVPIETVHAWIVTALEEKCLLTAVAEQQNADIVARCAEAIQVVADQSLSPTEMVEKLTGVINLVNPDALASEIEEFPPFAAIGNLDEEAEEAIQTAGSMAAVEMMSIVGSKGLSAHHVMILGCDDVNLNRTSRLTFFVGMTRARESLHLIASMKAGGSTGLHPFLKCLPSRHCDYVVYKKTGQVREQMADAAAITQRIRTWSRSASRSRR
jgi:superfamily I DNA/RNA helicase